MDCAEFQEVLHDLDRPGSEGEALCERALAHAEGCSDCATLLIEVESLDFSLRQAATESSELQAPARLETFVAGGISAGKGRDGVARGAVAVGGFCDCRGGAAGVGDFSSPAALGDAGGREARRTVLHRLPRRCRIIRRGRKLLLFAR